jgi:methionyl aminopeptidase
MPLRGVSGPGRNNSLGSNDMHMSAESEGHDHAKDGEGDEDPITKYRAAGKVAAQARDLGISLVVEGARLLEVCTEVERRIRDLGCEPAFPANISIDHVAAHYTSPHDDSSVFKKGQLVKVDVGAHLDGFIGDTAASVVVGGGSSDLMKSTEEAQDQALKIAGPGVMNNEVGRAIEEAIKGYGFVPIKQLSGHTLEQYVQHGGKTIPNFDMPHGEPLEVGEAYGLDIFASTGTGNVTESNICHIYAINQENPFPRLRMAKRLHSYILENYRTLPFTERWYRGQVAGSRLALLEMLQQKAIRKYGVLSESKGTLVAQSEHTFVVTENGIEITTESK